MNLKTETIVENRERRTGAHPTARKLAAYLDDSLDEDAEERVRKHIELCDPCRIDSSHSASEE